MDDYSVIILCLVFSAFFSGVEIAFLSVNKLKVELDAKQGNVSAIIISKFLRIPSRFIGAILVGNNIALVVYGIFMGDLITNTLFSPSFLESAPFTVLAVQTGISTLLVLFIAEFIPKALFRINPNGILGFLAIPIWAIYYLLYAITTFTIGLAEYLLRIFFKFDSFKENFVVSKLDLDNYLKEIKSGSSDKDEIDHEIQIFHNALDFNTVKARECMVPRNEIECAEIDDSLDIVRQKFINTGYSKILIYRDSIDNIIGYVHCNDLFKKPESIGQILLPVAGYFPETATADYLMEQLITKKKAVAVVVDEFGGTSGIITLEDVVEVIFGDIEDEHDFDSLAEQKIDDKTFLFAGRHEIDYLNEKYNLQLPESSEYETLAGLILHLWEDIPEVNVEVESEPYKFVVKKVSGNKIELVELQIEE
jgi:putative hemolysin